jgi:hypothetical protein
MGTFKSPKRAFNSANLDELQWILESEWSKVQARYPFRDQANDEKIKGILRRKLFAFACVGISDPEMLEAYLLNSMSLSYAGPAPKSRR